jgi:hypothetical protein
MQTKQIDAKNTNMSGLLVSMLGCSPCYSVTLHQPNKPVTRCVYFRSVTPDTVDVSVQCTEEGKDGRKKGRKERNKGSHE